MADGPILDEFDPTLHGDLSDATPAGGGGAGAPGGGPILDGFDPLKVGFLGDGGNQPSSSAFGAGVRSAARSAIPAAGGLAGAAAGAEAGAEIGGGVGTLIEPGGGSALGGVIGGFVGGVAGMFGGGAVAEKAQDYALEKAPDSWKEALGQDDRQQKLDQEQHSYASFFGGLAPFALTMSPFGEAGALAKGLAPNATALQRILANPVTARVFGGAAMGGLELGQEIAGGDAPDWTKVAVSTGFGVIFNRPNRLGERIHNLGGAPVRRLLGRPEPGVAGAPAAEPIAAATPDIEPDEGIRGEQDYLGAYGSDLHNAIYEPEPRDDPTLADLADLRIFGPGFTESTYLGDEDPSPEAKTTAAATRSAELDMLGARSANADVDARRQEPELFARYDALEAQRQTFADSAALSPVALTSLAETDKALDALRPDVIAARARAAEASGTGAAPGAPIEPAPQAAVSRETSPVSQAVAPILAHLPAEPEPRSIDEQRQRIADDVTARHIAAGRDPVVARAEGAVVAEQVIARATRFRGALGTPEELHMRESAGVGGPGQRAAPPDLREVLTRPSVAAAIGDPKINAADDVPYLAGASNRDTTTNIDRRIPEFDPAVTGVNGQPLSLWKYLNVHEQVERSVMEELIDGGWPSKSAYLEAHRNFATVAERAALEADGGDWARYTHVMDGFAAHIEHERPAHPPGDLYLKPYPEAQAETIRGHEQGGDNGEPEPAPPGRTLEDERAYAETLSAWKAEAPTRNLKETLAAARRNQKMLAEAGKEIEAETGIRFINPGVKSAASTREKLGRKGLASVGKLTDVVRGGFVVTIPAQAQEAIEALARRFTLIDEGWRVTPHGYFDRKVNVRFDDGQIGEIQLLEPTLFAAKESGGGHALYEQWKTADGPERDALAERMRRFYADVRAGLDPAFEKALGGGGAEGNRALNSLGASTEAFSPISAELAGSQAPVLGDNTQASRAVQSAGSPSQEQNTAIAIGNPLEPKIMSVATDVNPLADLRPMEAPVAAAYQAEERISALSSDEQRRELPRFGPAADAAIGPQANGRDAPAGVFMFDPLTLGVDAARFQFRSGGDKYGVTGALRSVTKWDRAKAQAIMVWEDLAGGLWVADGHQRAGLARRLTENGLAENIELPGVLYREKDGISADDIRAIAAVTNIANGSGSALDGAKVLRARPELLDGSVPLSIGKGDQAAALAALGDEPFRMVVNEVIPEHFGAIVGSIIPRDEARQIAAIKAIARFEPRNADEATALTQRVAQAEIERSERGRQISMFGDLETPESTAGEEMKIVGAAIKALKKDKSLFARVIANAQRIEETGSRIDRGAAAAIASDAETFAKVLASEAYSAGPVRDELKTTARELKNGSIAVGDASSRILAAIRSEVEEHGLDRSGPRGRADEPAPSDAPAEEAALELFQRGGAAAGLGPSTETEAGADIGPEGTQQTLIPGVRPITNRERIEAAARAPLRGGAAAPAEGGLFGEGKNQRDLFQAPPGAGVAGVQARIRLREGARSAIWNGPQANASSVMHEYGHDFLEQLLRDAVHPAAPPDIVADAAIARRYIGAAEGKPVTRGQHEKFARAFEQYLREGVAPTRRLAAVFAQFKSWLSAIYRTLKGLGAPINDDIRGVFDRLLGKEAEPVTIAETAPRRATLWDIHSGEAYTVAEEDAEPAADRVASEREQGIAEPPREIANELVAAVQTVEAQPPEAGAGAAPGLHEPGGEDGGGGGRPAEVVAGGGQAGPEPAGASLGAGGGPERAGGDRPEAKGGGLSSQPAADERSDRGPRPHPLAPTAVQRLEPVDERLVDRAGNTRVENLTNVAKVAEAIHLSAERNADFWSVRGRQTMGQMSDLADALGLDPAAIKPDVLSRLFGGTENLGAHILAARRLVVASAQIVADLMARVADSDDEKDVVELAQAIGRHDMIQSALSGVTAEWGRAGTAFRSLMDGWNKAKDVEALLRDNTGRTLYQLKMIAKLGKGLDTPGKVAKFLHDTKKRSFGRMVLEYWINGLISGPATHVTYVIGGQALIANRVFLETPIAAAIGDLKRIIGRDQATRTRWGEVGAGVVEYWRALPKAVQASIEALATGRTTLLPGETARPLTPFDTEALPSRARIARTIMAADVRWGEARADLFGVLRGMRDGVVANAALLAAGGERGAPFIGSVYSPLGHIPDIAVRGATVFPLGSLARAPSRAVAALHAFQRTQIYSIEANMRAYRQATVEGLSGAPLNARVAYLRQNPDAATMEAARVAATSLTLMDTGRELVGRVSRLFNWAPNLPLLGETPVLKFIDPFVHIASNIIDQTIVERSPAGLLAPHIRADLMGKNGPAAQDAAAARMLSGVVLSITIGGMAAEGLISGSGPPEPDKSAMWRLAGNQAHSVRIGDVWIDIHRLGPLGMMAGIAADLYDVAHIASQGDLLQAAALLQHAVTQNVLDESFMRGPADLIRATEDPGRYGERYLQQLAASFIPYSVGLGQIAQGGDPYMRRARTIMDSIRNQVPGLSETLFSRRDIWGEPMPNLSAVGARGITALYETRVSRDPVNLELAKLGLGPAPVPKTIRNVPLDDAQLDDFARLAGRMAKQRLDVVVNSPDWRTFPPQAKQNVVREILKQSREVARGAMFAKYPQILVTARALKNAPITDEDSE